MATRTDRVQVTIGLDTERLHHGVPTATLRVGHHPGGRWASVHTTLIEDYAATQWIRDSHPEQWDAVQTALRLAGTRERQQAHQPIWAGDDPDADHLEHDLDIVLGRPWWTELATCGK